MIEILFWNNPKSIPISVCFDFSHVRSLLANVLGANPGYILFAFA